MLVAFLAYTYMPDSADTAKFLTEEERQVAKIRAIQQTGTEGVERVGHINFRDVFMSLKDIKTWIPPFSKYYRPWLFVIRDHKFDDCSIIISLKAEAADFNPL